MNEAMSNTLKVTVTDADGNSREMSIDFSKPVLVGRSRSADLHLSEPDVSGRHFQFIPEPSGSVVEVLSRNGLVIDGKRYLQNDRAKVAAGNVINVGAHARIRVDEMPGGEETLQESGVGFYGGDTRASEGEVETIPDEVTPHDPIAPAEPLISEPFRPQEKSESLSKPQESPESLSTPPESPESLQKDAGFDDSDTSVSACEDSLTYAGDGETQEMKTRIGSLEEIAERKRQLDSKQIKTRLRIGGIIGFTVLALAGAWFYLVWKGKAIDVDGPYRLDGSYDEEFTWIEDGGGNEEFGIVYPRNDSMTVYVAPDSNTVKVATWFGNNSEIPFNLEFMRWIDRSDLAYSLEASFERWMIAEQAKGSAFETHGGRRPQGEFFENVFPGNLEVKSQRGVRFVRAEHTRSRDGDLWRGVSLYFRKGDVIHLLRLEIPDIFWKIASRRVTKELHLNICSVFLNDHWDSPGRFETVDQKLSDDELISRIRRELSADRVAVWPDLAAYIDTLLMRSWGEKPRIQKEAQAFFATMQDRMTRFYNERELAYETARANGDDKRMNAIFTDCKAAFGSMPRDRRLTLVNNPEIWSCHQGR